jgi:hypothetical protein
MLQFFGKQRSNHLRCPNHLEYPYPSILIFSFHTTGSKVKKHIHSLFLPGDFLSMLYFLPLPPSLEYRRYSNCAMEFFSTPFVLFGAAFLKVSRTWT